MENEGKSMTILGALLILTGFAAIVALLWSISRDPKPDENASLGWKASAIE